MEAQDHVVSLIREVFGRHGAVPMSSASLGYVTAEEAGRGAAAVLLAPCGTRMALRHEMRQPFAAWLARQAAQAAQGVHQGCLYILRDAVLLAISAS